jgi:hypothetical protein
MILRKPAESTSAALSTYRAPMFTKAKAPERCSLKCCRYERVQADIQCLKTGPNQLEKPPLEKNAGIEA